MIQINITKPLHTADGAIDLVVNKESQQLGHSRVPELMGELFLWLKSSKT